MPFTKEQLDELNEALRDEKDDTFRKKFAADVDAASKFGIQWSPDEKKQMEDMWKEIENGNQRIKGKAPEAARVSVVQPAPGGGLDWE